MFNLNPDANTEVPSIPLMDSNNLDFHKLSLTPDAVNSPITSYEQWLLYAKGVVSAQGAADTGVGLSHQIEREFAQLQREKVAEWIRQKEDAQLQTRSDDLAVIVMRPKGSVTIDTGKGLSLMRSVTKLRRSS